MPTRVIRNLLATLLLFALAPMAGAGAGTAVLSAEGELRLDRFVEFIEDPDHRYDIDSIREPSVHWQYNGDHAFNRAYSSSTWWLKLRVDNPGTETYKQLLEISYAALDHVNVYLIENGIVRQQFRMGDQLPFHERPFDHRFFVVPIEWAPGQAFDVYIQVRTGSTVQLPLTLWSYTRFYSVDTTSTILQGFYYGGMIAIAVYNLLIFFVLRSRTYLAYVGFVLSMPMFLGALSGQSFRFLWPTATTWNGTALIFFLASTCVCNAMFTRRFLRIDELSIALSRTIRIFAWLGFGLALASFFVPYPILVRVLVPLSMIGCCIGISAGIFAWLRKQPSARIYLAAWSCFLVGAAVMGLAKMNVLPVTPWTEYAAQFGSMVEAVLLSFALAERINHERRLRFDAQTATLQASQRMNLELEQRVQQRTQDLEVLNLRLQQLSDTDQLTQLKNRRALESQLAQEWARAERYGHSLALVLVDIDHFKAVNDRYGHPAGDSCLQQVAALIEEGVRWPGDTTSRYGGEEFCLLLPETDVGEARHIVDTLRERIANTQINTAAANFHVTISAGVFAATPDATLPVDAFIREADIALYQSKQRGRNCVTVSDSAPA